MKKVNDLDYFLTLLREYKITPTPKIICFLLMTDETATQEKEEFLSSFSPFMDKEEIKDTFEILSSLYIIKEDEGKELILFKPAILEILSCAGLELDEKASLKEIKDLLVKAQENILENLEAELFFHFLQNPINSKIN